MSCAGKVFEVELAETDPPVPCAQAEDMARRLLANTVIESFRVLSSMRSYLVLPMLLLN